jgi:Pyruvate/2-oxoacid:ferredoxin oxidoreductase gamma subunit
MAGGNQTVNQSQIGVSGSSDLSQEDVINLLVNLETLVRSANLPEAQTERVLKLVSVVKEEAESEEEPDKNFSFKKLKRATEVLKEAGETVEAGNSLWRNVQPIFNSLSLWLGAALL